MTDSIENASGYLWSKPGQQGPDAEMMAFLAGEDVILDRQLIAYDIRATQAHAQGLVRIGILTAEEGRAVSRCLEELLVLWRTGAFVLDSPHEDCHSAIEAYATQQLGELGRKIHTGRSRNDQILVASRLYLRDQLDALVVANIAVAEAALDRGQRDEMTPMPGYTHLQPAVPSSVGLWLACFAESFLDNARLARDVRDLIDQCPLGTAAGYGVNLALDRQGVAESLGFSRIQRNPMYAQNSRGKFELLALQALGQATLDLRRLAWDLSLYTSAEFDFIDLPAAMRTGSSIMPNKANPDLVELLRALHSSVLAAQIELDSVLSLSSGYHRDLQNTKPPMLRPWSRALSGLRLTARLLQSIQFKRERMRSAIHPSMYATDHALAKAASGVPFRDAYRDAMQADLKGDPVRSLRERTSPGACGDLGLNKIFDEIQAFKACLGPE